MTYGVSSRLFGRISTMSLAETRYDGMVPAQLSLPTDGSFSPILDAVPMEETDLLSMTAVATAKRTNDHGTGPSFRMIRSVTVLLMKPPGRSRPRPAGTPPRARRETA